MATVKIGYALSSEEHTPKDLVRHARLAEAGRLHVWLNLRPFSPLGRCAGPQPIRMERDRRDRPRHRAVRDWHRRHLPDHPHPPSDYRAGGGDSGGDDAGAFLPGRRYRREPERACVGRPLAAARSAPEMLEEAVHVIRQLWQGGSQSHHGKHYTVENARLYTLPEELPQIMVAASGPQAAEAAGRFGDGLCSTAPNPEIIKACESRRWEWPALRSNDGVLGGERGRGPAHRAQDLAQRRAWR